MKLYITKDGFLNGKPFIFLLSGLIVFFLYYPVLLSPNEVMFSNEGDGIKNYFTYAFYIKNNNSWLNFEALNYPYKENVFFTDCQVLIAFLLRLVSKLGIPVEEYSIGIINVLMVSSLGVSIVVVQRFFLLLKQPIGLATLFAIGIGMLSPQTFRLEGHFSLAYSFAIPLSLYLMLRSETFGYTFIQIFLQLFINMCWMFIHPYLGVIIILFQLVFYSYKYLSSKKIKYLYILITLLLIVFGFKFITAITDMHINRTNNPSGFFLYNAELDDVFIPNSKPLYPLIKSLVPKLKLQGEAIAYVGWVNTMVFVFLILTLLRSLVKRKNFFKSWSIPQVVWVLWFSSIPLLIFAMGEPFKQLPVLLDYLPFIKQFRATGRFTWTFYYTWTLLSTLFIIQVVVRYNKSKVLLFVSFLLPMSIIVEAYAYHEQVLNKITRSENILKDQYLDLSKISGGFKLEQYQAILPLPFYNKGSESYLREVNSESVKLSMSLCYETKIPILSNFLSRTSIDEAKKMQQIVSAPYYDIGIANDITSSKEILVIEARKEQLTENEKDILNRAKNLYCSDNYTVSSITPEQLFDRKNKEVHQAFRQKKKGLYIERKGYLVSDSLAEVYSDDFESLSVDVTHKGKGAYSGVKKGKNFVKIIPSNTFKNSGMYRMSIWLHNGEPDALNLYFRLFVFEVDPKGKIVNETRVFPEHAETIAGNWSLVELDFDLKDVNNRLEICTIGKDNSKANLYADNLLIRKKGVNVYKEIGNDVLYYNNHFVKVKTSTE